MKKKSFIVGLAGLFLGSLIYLTDRPLKSTWFVREFLNSIGYSLDRDNFIGLYKNLFGAFDKSIASFLHTFSFTLITGSFNENRDLADNSNLTKNSKKGYLTPALFWCCVNLLFEIGQYFDSIAVKLIPNWFNEYKFLNTVDDYFIAGVFDFWDIAAIITGAFLGYLLLNYYE
ncbi:MAG: hypothetical protein HQK72_09550 [Desulfamplus sp.]|nr:hypothetical protein [Desulfamplus sp.]